MPINRFLPRMEIAKTRSSLFDFRNFAKRVFENFLNIENMRGFLCQNCDKREDLFSTGPGSGAVFLLEIPFLGRIPIDPHMGVCADAGDLFFEKHPESEVAEASNLVIEKKTIEFFDERYPGKMPELASMLFGEKSFIMSDYIRQIISGVFTFANMGSTIFVGRGAHLILPRKRVLAVRIVCSNEYRIARLADILDVEETEAEKLLHQIDQKQHAFFKKAFGKKDASPYEFDLVINCDFIVEPQGAAEVIACVFKEKFAAELEETEFIEKKAV